MKLFASSLLALAFAVSGLAQSTNLHIRPATAVDLADNQSNELLMSALPWTYIVTNTGVSTIDTIQIIVRKPASTLPPNLPDPRPVPIHPFDSHTIERFDLHPNDSALVVPDFKVTGILRGRQLRGILLHPIQIDRDSVKRFRKTLEMLKQPGTSIEIVVPVTLEPDAVHLFTGPPPTIVGNIICYPGPGYIPPGNTCKYHTGYPYDAAGMEVAADCKWPGAQNTKTWRADTYIRYTSYACCSRLPSDQAISLWTFDPYGDWFLGRQADAGWVRSGINARGNCIQGNGWACKGTVSTYGYIKEDCLNNYWYIAPIEFTNDDGSPCTTSDMG